MDIYSGLQVNVIDNHVNPASRQNPIQPLYHGDRKLADILP
jgi:hypothetical protein